MSDEKYKKGGPLCIFRHQMVSSSDLYENVKFLFPYESPNTFHGELAVYEDTHDIIRNSNSFIDDTQTKSPEYESKHGIYARMNRTYDILCNSSPEECIEERVCSFMSPFDSVNFGHNLSIVFDFIHQYRIHKLAVPIVISKASLLFPNIIRILELFFDDIRIIETNKVYSFKQVFFFKPLVLDICRHDAIIQETIERVLEKIPVHDSYLQKNVFLVKVLGHQSNIVERGSAFEAERLFDELKKRSEWIVIQPEVMSIYDIIAYLHYAKTIVTSEGSISYGHGIFFNTNAKPYYLVQPRGVYPYAYLKWMKRIDVSRNLDDHIQLICNLDTYTPPLPPPPKPLVYSRRALPWLYKVI